MTSKTPISPNNKFYPSMAEIARKPFGQRWEETNTIIGTFNIWYDRIKKDYEDKMLYSRNFTQYNDGNSYDMLTNYNIIQCFIGWCIDPSKDDDMLDGRIREQLNQLIKEVIEQYPQHYKAKWIIIEHILPSHHVDV
jgi:hypothetical protein